jgi:SH3-like domain-containing protein
MFQRLIPAVPVLLLVSLLASCATETTRRKPVLAVAYVGPITVNLRQEISLKSPTVTMVKHGDKVGVLEQRRRFVLVRAPNGKEGWTDTRQLITPDQMAELNATLRRASDLPSQGVASTFEPVNAHAEPNRASPSFFQLREGTKVDVIGHKLTPRVQGASAPPPRLIPPRPKIARKPRKEDERKARFRPPLPAGPALPDNYMELSKTNAPPPEPDSDEPARPVPMDDWTQVRAKDGRVGWVLSRMLNMAIPDEVAQYSEGHRITSYFNMGLVHDGDLVKPNWLWTTLSKANAPYDFDSFRYFIWNPHHHRYETAYVQRKVIGYYPVFAEAGSPPKFTLLMQDEDDGKLYRYYYIYDIYRVRLVGKQLYVADQNGRPSAQPSIVPVTEQPAAQPTLLARIKRRISHLLGH